MEIKRNKHHFCSMDCKSVWQRETDYMCGQNNPSWQGGLNCRYRGSNWVFQRQKALERDNYQCQRCPVSDIIELVVHHKKPYQLFDNYIEANELSNLVTLCKRCHQITEQEFSRSHPELLQLRRIPKTPPEPRKCIGCDKIFQPLKHHIKACLECMIIKCANCGKDYRVKEYAMTKFQQFCSPICVNEHFSKNGIWPVRKVTQSMISLS